MKKCLTFVRRKGSNTNEKMKNIINNIEREIEEELDLRSESNDFITSDVKAILKVSNFFGKKDKNYKHFLLGLGENEEAQKST